MPPNSVEVRMEDRSVKLPDIPVGVPGSFTDYDPAGATVLIVSTNPEDDGGIVYRQPQRDTQEVFNRVLRTVRLDTGEIEAVIGKDQTVELPLVTKLGEAVLTLRHF